MLLATDILVINCRSEMAGDSTQNKEFDRSRRRISAYLSDMGYHFEVVPHPRAAWLIVVDTPAGFKVGILQTRDRIGLIGLDGSVTVSEDQQQGLAALSPSERRDLVFAMRFRLLSMGVDFYGVDDPLETIHLQTVVYLEGLTRAAFDDKIALIARSKMAIVWMIDEKLSFLRPNSVPSESVN